MASQAKLIVPTIFILTMLGSVYQALADTTVLGEAGISSRPSTVTCDFTVTSIRATIDEHPATVVENPATLGFVSPAFKCNATVRCTIPAGVSFTVGFIQQVDSQDERFDYKRAFTNFELPSYPISDSDGTDPPWANNDHQRVTGISGVIDRDIEVSCDDIPSGNVGWREPLPPDGKKEGPKLELQHLKRAQKLTTWLAAKDEHSGQITILRKISWSLRLDISVNPEFPLGWRVTNNSATIEQPIITMPSQSDQSTFFIPPQCLAAPYSNNAEQLWWNPKKDGIGTRTRLQ